MHYIDIILRGLLTGFLIAYLIILGLRPAVMYPDNILDIIDNPWVFLVLLVINYYIYLWDDTIGILMFLTLIALMLDIILFTEGGFFKDNVNVEIFSNQTYDDIKKVDFIAPAQSTMQTSYKDINNKILEKLQNMKKLAAEREVDHVQPSLSTLPAPFL